MLSFYEKQIINVALLIASCSNLPHNSIVSKKISSNIECENFESNSSFIYGKQTNYPIDKLIP